MQLFETISVLAACWTIIAGVYAWKREFVGKRKIELAEEVLALFYECRDAFKFIRSPWSNSTEGKTRKRGPHEFPAESEVKDRAYIVFERYDKKADVFNRLNASKYRFMAAFGNETEVHFKKITEALNTIFHASNTLAEQYWHPFSKEDVETEEEKRMHQEFRNRYESIFWEIKSEEDPIDQLIAPAISEIERILRNETEKELTLYSMLLKKINPK